MQSNRIWKVFFLIAGILLAVYSCEKKSSKLNKALRLAGDNKQELIKVLDHYKELGDDLKYKATLFLIENMPGLKTIESKWIDNDGNESAPLKVLDYPDLLSFRNAMDSIGMYQTISDIEDIQGITSKYLINNIDLAFYAWQNLPYSKNLNFEQFCEYILPYRIGTEKLINWRSTILSQYEEDTDFYDSILTIGLEGTQQWYKENWKWELKDDSTIQRWRSRLIFETIVAPKCKYDVRSHAFNPHLNYHEMNEYNIGDCVDQANYFTLVMRALGMASFYDFMPIWGNRSSSHYTNAFYDEQRVIRPVHLLYTNMQKAAKVSRKTYSIQKNSLAEIVKDKSMIPPFLRDNRMIDITSEYCPVSDIEIKVKDRHTEDEYAYLSVYQEGRFHPVHWAKIMKNGNAVFNDMSNEIIYFPVIYRDRKYHHVGNPLIVSENKIMELESDLISNSRFRLERNVGVNFKGHLKLFYWYNNKWVLLLEKENIDIYKVKFNNIPSNCVYKIINTSSNHTSLFTIEQDTIKLRYFSH